MPDTQNDTSTPDEWDDSWDMCPNCVTPWKCNGPHLMEETEAYRRFGTGKTEAEEMTQNDTSTH